MRSLVDYTPEAPVTVRSSAYSPKLSFSERQAKHQETRLAYAKISTLPIAERKFQHLLQSKNPYKQSYFGHETQSEEELTFQPQILAPSGKITEGKIFEKLYQSGVEQRQKKEKVTGQIFSFQPEINADKETFSKYMSSFER